jgi:hypothetical protein
MVVMFVPTEVPDTCYLAEVAFWLAFGRVPGFHPEGLEADSRAGERIEAGESLPEFHLLYSEREFSFARITIDYHRYLEVRDEIAAHSGAEFMNSFESHAGQLNPDGHLPDKEAQEFRERLESLRQHIQRKADELNWAISMEERLYRFIDVARATAFQSLASGRLKATGYVYEASQAADNNPDDEFEEEHGVDQKGEWTQIDPRLWTWRNFDWEKSMLITPQATFHAVQVSTEDMLGIFPKPSCEAVSSRAIIYAGVVMLEDGEMSGGIQAVSARRPRGKPLKGDGAIKTAVQTTFEKLIRQGRVPAKREALLEEIVAYVEETFKEKISRGTARTYIAPVWKSLGKLPENRVRK